MSAHNHEHGTEPFSLYYFLWTNLLTLIVIAGGFKLVAPQFWTEQLSFPWYSYVLTFLAIHFGYSFVEYFFHRYILHTKTWRAFEYFYRAHTSHHAHTNIEIEAERFRNNYPIEHQWQLEASFFPWYSYALFALMITPILFGVQALIDAPIVVVGYVGVFYTIFLYEVLHQLFHLPLLYWQPFFANSRYGALARRVYAFHLDHHRNPGCNESVSGFFGVPVTDLIFGTYAYHHSLYETGTPCAAIQLKPVRPRWPIRWLDRQLVQ